MLQFYKGTHPSTYNLQVHSTSREFSIQNQILHAEDKELFKYYYWCESRIQKRNSTHRRQGDLLEMHPYVTKTFQAFQPQDLPKALQILQTFQSFQTFQTFQSFQSFKTFQSFQTLQRHFGHSSHS